MQHANKTRGVGPLGSSGVIAQWGASSLIKSVQRGTTAITSGNTATNTTITAVDTKNCIVSFIGCMFGSNNIAWDSATARVQLTSSTNIQAVRQNSGGAGQITLGWEVIEFIPGVIKSIQVSSVTSNGSATITAVNIARSLLTYQGWTGSDTTINAMQVVEIPRIALASATSVTCANGNGDANSVAIFQVTEFF